jgi:outer membrane protein TolC
MRRAAIATLLLALVPAACGQEAAPSAGEILTLDRAISLAEAGNRQIKIASEELDKANEAVLAARTQRLPQFQVDALGSELLAPLKFEFDKGVLGDVNGSPVPSSNVDVTMPRRPFAFLSLQATQPLSQLHRISLGIREQEVGVKLAKESLRAQRQQTIHDVRATYYSLLQTQSAITEAEANVKTYRELDRTTDRFLAERTVLQYQSLGVKAQLAKSELDLVTLQDSLATQKERFSVLLGRDVLSDFSVAGIPDETPEEADIAAARKQALENRSEIRQASLKIDQAAFAIREERAKYIPDVSLAFNYYSFFNSQVLPRNVVSAGVLVSWDIFDWGYKRHLVEQRQHDAEESRVNLTEAQSQVVVDLDARFRKLREARAGLKVAQLAQDAEKEKLRVVLEQYQQKAALLTDALQEQAAEAQANTNYQQALANFWTARADFEKSLGED